MTDSVKNAVNDIKSNKASCIVINEGKTVKSILARGIRPILEMLDENILRNSTVVDKVVGRAAALVMVYGEVKACYALTLSRGALSVFQKHKVFVEYENIVPYIINRTGDGVCPMEQAVMEINNPETALGAIKNKLDELK